MTYIRVERECPDHNNITAKPSEYDPVSSNIFVKEWNDKRFEDHDQRQCPGCTCTTHFFEITKITLLSLIQKPAS